jgi:hypothetical protein
MRSPFKYFNSSPEVKARLKELLKKKPVLAAVAYISDVAKHLGCRTYCLLDARPVGLRIKGMPKQI